MLGPSVGDEGVSERQAPCGQPSPHRRKNCVSRNQAQTLAHERVTRHQNQPVVSRNGGGRRAAHRRVTFSRASIATNLEGRDESGNQRRNHAGMVLVDLFSRRCTHQRATAGVVLSALRVVSKNTNELKTGAPGPRRSLRQREGSRKRLPADVGALNPESPDAGEEAAPSLAR